MTNELSFWITPIILIKGSLALHQELAHGMESLPAYCESSKLALWTAYRGLTEGRASWTAACYCSCRFFQRAPTPQWRTASSPASLTSSSACTRLCAASCRRWCRCAWAGACTCSWDTSPGESCWAVPAPHKTVVSPGSSWTSSEILLTTVEKLEVRNDHCGFLFLYYLFLEKGWLLIIFYSYILF